MGIITKFIGIVSSSNSTGYVWRTPYLNTVGLLDEKIRLAVLAAFEHVMHSSFGKPFPLSDCETKFC
jgi:hypothetical protein